MGRESDQLGATAEQALGFAIVSVAAVAITGSVVWGLFGLVTLPLVTRELVDHLWTATRATTEKRAGRGASRRRCCCRFRW
jgi:hypothetical protein